MKVRAIRIPVVIATILLLTLHVQAQALQARKTLQGLSGVRVVVEEMPISDGTNQGLTDNAILTDVELKLRRIPIRVLSEKEWLDDERNPTLYINLSLVRGSTPGIYGYNLSLQVEQSVIIKTNPQTEVLGTTWSKNVAGTIGYDRLRQLRDLVIDKLDYFINDYLAANPRKN